MLGRPVGVAIVVRILCTVHLRLPTLASLATKLQGLSFKPHGTVFFFVFERLFTCIEFSFLIKFVVLFSVLSTGTEVMEYFCK